MNASGSTLSAWRSSTPPGAAPGHSQRATVTAPAPLSHATKAKRLTASSAAVDPAPRRDAHELTPARLQPAPARPAMPAGGIRR